MLAPGTPSGSYAHHEEKVVITSLPVIDAWDAEITTERLPKLQLSEDEIDRLDEED